MEEMDIDQLVDVPDTPDRLNPRHLNCLKLGKSSNSSLAGQLANSQSVTDGCSDQTRTKSRLFFRDGRKNHIPPQRSPVTVDKIEHFNKPITVGPSRSSNADKDTPVSKSAVNPKPDARQSLVPKFMHKGKALAVSVPSESTVPIEDNNIIDLTEQSKRCCKSDICFQQGASKDIWTQGIREAQVSSDTGSSLRSSTIPFTFSQPSIKGKEKVGLNTSTSGLARNHGKGIDVSGSSQCQSAHQNSSIYAYTPSRVTGQKRLVRNGCISPHNIAKRMHISANSRCVGSINVVENPVKSTGSDSPPVVNIKDIVARSSIHGGAKGDNAMSSNLSTSKEHDKRVVHVSSSSSVVHNETARRTSGCNSNVPLGNWRTTRNRTREVDLPSGEYHLGKDFETTKCLVSDLRENRGLKMDDRKRNFTKEASGPELRTAARTEPSRAAGLSQIGAHHQTRDMVCKRKRKGEFTSRNRGECSRVVPDDGEISFLGSASVLSSSRSPRNHRQYQGALHPIYEIEEVSPTIKTSDSQHTDPINNYELDARARQVDADEMLARELQEQLYQEAPVFVGSEIDESIAWAMQQHDIAQSSTSTENLHAPLLRNSSILHTRRPSQRRSSTNPSNRRGTQVRGPATRASQLRNRLLVRSPSALSRDRHRRPAALPSGTDFHFPVSMSLEMRLDMLEALEAAEALEATFGDLNDTVAVASQLFRAQRDFNENDYEMLLALDENNRHCGASANQINNLPESVVQTENFEETCAVCLENPTIGEAIRHLPCLHKFHKDCIDPWLRRRTSCPVCKSSIR